MVMAISLSASAKLVMSVSSTSTRLPLRANCSATARHDVRHEQALDDRVGGGVHEEDGARQGAGLLERVAEVEVVVVLEPHAAEHDDVDLGLQGDAGEQLVVRLARDREDGQLLRLHQAC